MILCYIPSIYFKSSDIAKGFKIQFLIKILCRKQSTYTINIDYNIFVSAIGTNSSNNTYKKHILLYTNP
jgi:hypothetical protein